MSLIKCSSVARFAQSGVDVWADESVSSGKLVQAAVLSLDCWGSAGEGGSVGEIVSSGNTMPVTISQLGLEGSSDEPLVSIYRALAIATNTKAEVKRTLYLRSRLLMDAPRIVVQAIAGVKFHWLCFGGCRESLV
jgi:hypothetical protein